MSGPLGAAWSFLRPAWRRAWLTMSLAGMAWGLSLASVGGLAWPWRLLTALSVLITSGALWPLATCVSEARGFLPSRIVEVRLLAVALLSLVFLFVLFLLVFILVLCFAYGAAASGHGFEASQIATWAPAVDGRGRRVVTLIALVAFAALAWAAMRISLAAPATVERGRVQVLATWPLTRGQAWRIALTNALTLMVPAALIAALIAARGQAGSPGLRLGLDLLQGMVLTGLGLPLTIGLMGYLYRDLSSVQTAAQIP